MKTRPEIYRDKAREIERLASEAHDPAVKEQLTTLARVWREMADVREEEDDTEKKTANIASTQIGKGPARAPGEVQRLVKKSQE